MKETTTMVEQKRRRKSLNNVVGAGVFVVSGWRGALASHSIGGEEGTKEGVKKEKLIQEEIPPRVLLRAIMRDSSVSFEKES